MFGRAERHDHVRRGLTVGRPLPFSALGWTNVAIREQLTADLGRNDIEIRVARPAALTTIAEWQAVPYRRDLICVQAGEHGIGTGIVIDGSLATGGHGHAGVVIADDQLGLGQLLGHGRDHSIERLAARLELGDPEVRDAYEAFAARFVEWLVPVVALLDTRMVVLAGYLQMLGTHLLPSISKALDEVSGHTPGADVDVRLGVNGAGAFRIGGAVMLADHTLRQATTAALDGSAWAWRRERSVPVADGYIAAAPEPSVSPRP